MGIWPFGEVSGGPGEVSGGPGEVRVLIADQGISADGMMAKIGDRWAESTVFWCF